MFIITKPLLPQGSGWGWLAYDKSTGGLDIVTTQNQDPCIVTVRGIHGLTASVCRTKSTCFPLVAVSQVARQSSPSVEPVNVNVNANVYAVLLKQKWPVTTASGACQHSFARASSLEHCRRTALTGSTGSDDWPLPLCHCSHCMRQFYFAHGVLALQSCAPLSRVAQ